MSALADCCIELYLSMKTREKSFNGHTQQFLWLPVHFSNTMVWCEEDPGKGSLRPWLWKAALLTTTQMLWALMSEAPAEHCPGPLNFGAGRALTAEQAEAGSGWLAQSGQH